MTVQSVLFTKAGLVLVLVPVTIEMWNAVIPACDDLSICGVDLRMAYSEVDVSVASVDKVEI